tara:strand:- start:454 stop:1002 length:549 start_codon:yes stop_codon:yes gene_type:complete
MLKFLPNLITISRIFLMFPLIYFLNLNDKFFINQLFSIMFILIIFLSDVLDGFLARKLNVVTQIGKILDPVSDKICLMVMLIFLIQKYGIIFLIFFILISIRDLVLVTLTCYLAINYNYVSQANQLGKNFMFSCVIMIIMFIFNFNYFISFTFYIITILLMIFSTLSYMKTHLNNIKKYENI